MFRSTLLAIAVACASLTSLSSVNAGPMASNSTQALSIHSPFPGNPFEGVTIDIRSDSFSNSIIDLSMDAELDRRLPVAAIVRGAAKIIELIFNKVKQALDRDKKRRGEFTIFLVAEGRKQRPEFNWIACHTKHRTKFKGKRGKDWGHQHREFDVSFKKTIGYEVYFAREGEFWRDGDGGYLNWAYSGFYKTNKKGKHITFTRPPGK